MLVMLVVMLVEGVFLVRGVVKTVFPPNKKNRRKFFFFHHEQKRVKLTAWEFLNRLFSLRKRRDILYNFVELFFYSVKTFFIELVPCIF